MYMSIRMFASKNKKNKFIIKWVHIKFTIKWVHILENTKKNII